MRYFIVFLIITLGLPRIFAQTEQIQNLAEDEKIKKVLSKYDQFSYDKMFSEFDQMNNYLAALNEITVVTKLLIQIQSATYINVAPDIPEGEKVDVFIFSGMDPKNIPNPKIRKAYEEKIAKNQNNLIISSRLSDIQKELEKNIKLTVEKLPGVYKSRADSLLNSVLNLRR